MDERKREILILIRESETAKQMTNRDQKKKREMAAESVEEKKRKEKKRVRKLRDGECWVTNIQMAYVEFCNLVLTHKKRQCPSLYAAEIHLKIPQKEFRFFLKSLGFLA